MSLSLELPYQRIEFYTLAPGDLFAIDDVNVPWMKLVVNSADLGFNATNLVQGGGVVRLDLHEKITPLVGKISVRIK